MWRVKLILNLNGDLIQMEPWVEQGLMTRKHTSPGQWTMHPWERDARMARKALDGCPQAYGLLIELACTRSSDELLGARKAYRSLYGESIKEDVASRVEGIERQVSTTFSNVFFFFFSFLHQTIFEVYEHYF